jgi:hypothetical protein
MSVRSALWLAALVFLLTLLVRLPASLLLDHLPGTLRCSSAYGTLWRGSCAELVAGPRRLSGVNWTLHPAALLRARVALDLASADPAASGQAYVEWQPGGELLIEHLAATLAPSQLTGLLPTGWSASLQLAIAHARVRERHLVALEGTLDLQQLQLLAPRTAFGSFELAFPKVSAADPRAEAPMRGTLRDLDGPLSMRGQMQLSPGGSYELEAKVAAHEDADPGLRQLLELLGPPDAQGARDFSFAGTL